MNKEKMKEIYDFVSSENIKSFHYVAFGILPNIRLTQLISRNTTIEPVLHIILNSAICTYIKDKERLSKRFKDIPIFYEHYDESLWIDL